ncbi:MAG: immunity 40 family protein [Campylobacteraceae bacterium]|jgi:hypothetical protein|nr:immunity 40 family protein [Campylobacteraceae bacterium]
MCNIVWSKEADDILSAGSALWDADMHNWILNRNEAKVAILKLLEFGIPILGGDVCRKIDNRFKYTYDSWHCDKNIIETDLEYLKRSINRSLEYINSYPLNCDTYFTLVPKRV